MTVDAVRLRVPLNAPQAVTHGRTKDEVTAEVTDVVGEWIASLSWPAGVVQ